VVWFPNKGAAFRGGKALLWSWAATVFACGMILENKWMRWFIIASVIKMCTNYGDWSFYTFNYIVVGCMAYQGMVMYFRKTRDYNGILNVICILALMQSVMIFLQHHGIWLFGIKPLLCNVKEIHPWLSVGVVERGMNGFLCNRNVASAFLAICMPAFFRDWWYWGILVLGVALFLLTSLGGIIPAIFCGILFFIIRDYKNNWMFNGKQNAILIGAGIVFVIVVMFARHMDIGFGAREQYWKDTWNLMIKPHWILGWGVGLYKYYFPLLANIREGYAHNEFLQVWAEHGIAGFICVVGFVVSMLVRGWRMYARPFMLIALCGFLIGVINCGANFTMHTTIGFFVLVWAAMIESEFKGGM